MEKLLEVALVDNKFDGAGKWAITVRQVDGDSDKVPACQSGGEGWGGCGGDSTKDQWPLPTLVFGRKQTTMVLFELQLRVSVKVHGGSL